MVDVELYKKVLERADGTMTAQQIAVDLKMPVNQVYFALATRFAKPEHRFKSLEPSRGVSKPWPDWKVDKLVMLWRQGLPCSQIAARISPNLSRNAVIGKLNRMGLTRGAMHLHPKRRPSSQPPRPRNRKFAFGNNAGQPRQEQTARLAPEPPPVEKKDQVQVMQLAADQCKWIYGDVRDPVWHFCDKTRVDGLPYCKHHAGRAYCVTNIKKRSYSAFARLMAKRDGILTPEDDSVDA